MIDEVITLADAYDVPIAIHALLDMSKTGQLPLCALDQFARPSLQ